MKIGGKYNWIGQPERLVYIGKNYHGLWCGYYSASRILTEEEAK